MPRYFNTTGPCSSERHYMLPAEARLPDLVPWVEREQYFVLHAARQTGKTTAMLSLAARLRARGFAAMWATLETSQGFEDVGEAEALWIAALEDAFARQHPPGGRVPREELVDAPVGSRLGRWLGAWCRAVATPAVLLLDEVDVVTGPALVNLLRQLRAGFTTRGAGAFPVSVGLIGMRDLRDYLPRAKDGTAVNPGSPFNVKVASVTLRNFSPEDVTALYAQHTADTGQRFLPEASERAWWWTEGQPFLVNALADHCVTATAAGGSPITAAHVDAAKEALILARTTHLDSLGQRLREPRVARVIEAVLLGDKAIAYDEDEYTYAVDLGLVVGGPGGATIANPLYREVLARQLSYSEQRNLPEPWWPWARADRTLEVPALVAAFLEWWRENAPIVEERTDRGYLEALPHLLFMAFLQRVVNGGGTILREYAAGRGALDLLVTYRGQKHVFEIKRVPPRHVAYERVRERGLAQVARYMDTVGVTEAWLLIFDQRPGRTWEERLLVEDVELDGRHVHLRGG